LQTLVFLAAFIFAPKQGILATRRAIRAGGGGFSKINQPRMDANGR